MCWDSDKFIGVEGFKKMIPKHNFTTLGKYLHLADLTKEDWNYLLCKVCPLVAHLEQKFAKALTPGKNITVGEGHVNLQGGFPSSRTFQWSLMNLVANFGFLLKLTHIMFHTKNQTNSELFQRKHLHICWFDARIPSTNRKDYSSDLEQLKLIPGKVWTQQIENLDATMWRQIHVISLLSTNTSPESKIHAIQQVVHEP